MEWLIAYVSGWITAIGSHSTFVHSSVFTSIVFIGTVLAINLIDEKDSEQREELGSTGVVILRMIATVIFATLFIVINDEAREILFTYFWLIAVVSTCYWIASTILVSFTYRVRARRWYKNVSSDPTAEPIEFTEPVIHDMLKYAMFPRPLTAWVLHDKMFPINHCGVTEKYQALWILSIPATSLYQFVSALFVFILLVTAPYTLAVVSAWCIIGWFIRVVTHNSDGTPPHSADKWEEQFNKMLNIK